MAGRGRIMERTTGTQVQGPCRLWRSTLMGLLGGLALGLVMTPSAQADDEIRTITSPDKGVTLFFNLRDGSPYYAISKGETPVIMPSRLGFEFKTQPALATGFVLAQATERQVNETWEQPWGEARFIRNHYNELKVDLVESQGLRRKMTVAFRVYNDGVGFRYEFPRQAAFGSVEITDELTEFVLPGDHDTWWIKAYQPDRYEYLHEETRLSRVDEAHTPFTMRAVDGTHIAIHEAALVDFASMVLKGNGQTMLKADLVPWSDGVKVRKTGPFTTPWRTVQIASDAAGLAASHLILNLNEPNALGDVSWVRPGKYVGIWWAMHIAEKTWESGSKHGATTEETKRYIDFASRHGLNGVLVEGWNVGWDGDWIENGELFRFTEAYPDFDPVEVATYARERGVDLIMHHETSGGIENYERQMAGAYDFLQSLGVNHLKTGYVEFGQGVPRRTADGQTVGEWHHGQYMVRHYLRSVWEASKRQIAINTHEPIKDTGLRRTYPNWMTREGLRGQEYNAWSEGNDPQHTTILPFTRMLSGPADFTPGIFNMFPKGKASENRIRTTLAKQLALMVVLYSPLQMAADLPRHYEERPVPFQFVIDVPTDWDDTRVLNGAIGDFVTIARKDRNSADWYLGAVTDEMGRRLEVPLDFLDPGTSYRAQIYRDGDDADWDKNPYSLKREDRTVTSEETLTLVLAPGGGQAIRFLPLR